MNYTDNSPRRCSHKNNNSTEIINKAIVGGSKEYHFIEKKVVIHSLQGLGNGLDSSRLRAATSSTSSSSSFGKMFLAFSISTRIF